MGRGVGVRPHPSPSPRGRGDLPRAGVGRDDPRSPLPLVEGTGSSWRAPGRAGRGRGSFGRGLRKIGRVGGEGVAIQRVGYIGVGNMGGPIAENVVKGGFDLMVFDLNQGAMD